MWWLTRLAACALMIVPLEALALGDSERIPLHLRPDSGSAITTLLAVNIPYKIERVEGPWTEVSQGSVVGWAPTDRLPLYLPSQGRTRSNLLRFLNPTISLDRSAPNYAETGLAGLVQFVVGNREFRMKMHDPFFRDRVVSLSSEWGPFYSLRTRYFYVKGICLKRIFRDQVRLNLAKRRMSYSEMFGSLWSDEFLTAVIDSNRGLLGNQKLFGKGREYFLELSLRF